jgi:hypothetical protein
LLLKFFKSVLFKSLQQHVLYASHKYIQAHKRKKIHQSLTTEQNRNIKLIFTLR